MKAFDERTFTPIAYRRDDLVYEVDWLNGPKVARWLATQTDDVLEEIMDQTADRMSDGETLLFALKDAMQSAYLAADPPARGFGKRSALAGERLARREERA